MKHDSVTMKLMGEKSAVEHLLAELQERDFDLRHLSRVIENREGNGVHVFCDVAVELKELAS